jgi:hypothetical protein
MEKKMLEDCDIQRWLTSRKEAGLKIDPETAEVDWEYGQVMDPYGVYPDLPEECYQVGRQYFARSPGSDIWVHFRDLPDDIRNALWEKHKSQLAFPAGLPDRIVDREWQNEMANALAALDRESRVRECLVRWATRTMPYLENSQREDLVQYLQQRLLKTAADSHSDSIPAENPS